MFERNPLAVKK